MITAWKTLCQKMMLRKEFIVAGVQRIHRNVRWQLSPEQWGNPMTLESTGYTQAKITQLLRNYWDEVSFTRAKADYHWRIEHRKYGSGVAYFRGIPKKNTKQDYCITSMTMSYYPGHGSIIDINYRTVELIKRFRGDLVFFPNHVFPFFDIKDLLEVNFSFTNATLHPMFTILLAPHIDLIDILRQVRETNFRMYRDCLYWAFRYLFWQDSVNKYSSARQVIRIAESQCDTKALETAVASMICRDISHFPDSVKKWEASYGRS